VLTKRFDMKSLEDNFIYKSSIGRKLIYAAHSDLTSIEKARLNEDFKLSVRLLPTESKDPFMFVINDMKREDPAGLISIECGPTLTGPLYSSVKNEGPVENPVDALYLSRYTGPVRDDALGPRFSSLSEISKTFKLMSSNHEVSHDGGVWTFEQWDKII